MQPNTTLDSKLSSLACQLTLAITILAVVWSNLVDLRIRFDITLDTIFLISSYVLLIVYCRFIRQNTKVARMLITVGQLAVVIFMGVTLSYAASTVPLPYRDAELHALDRWLGFEREAYLAFLKWHNGLREILYFAYRSMEWQTLLVCVVPLIVRRVDRLQVYVIAFAIAVIATVAIASVVPAANALIYVDKVPTDVIALPNGGHSYFPILEALRVGTLRIVDFGAIEGLISFPSFHTANAILFVWALWPIRLLRYLILPLNLLLIAGTPLGGSHYLVDLVGGAAVAFAAIFATSWLMRSPAEVDSRSRSVEEPLTVRSAQWGG